MRVGGVEEGVCVLAARTFGPSYGAVQGQLLRRLRFLPSSVRKCPPGGGALRTTGNAGEVGEFGKQLSLLGVASGCECGCGTTSRSRLPHRSRPPGGVTGCDLLATSVGSPSAPGAGQSTARPGIEAAALPSGGHGRLYRSASASAGFFEKTLLPQTVVGATLCVSSAPEWRAHRVPSAPVAQGGGINAGEESRQKTEDNLIMRELGGLEKSEQKQKNKKKLETGGLLDFFAEWTYVMAWHQSLPWR